MKSAFQINEDRYPRWCRILWSIGVRQAEKVWSRYKKVSPIWEKFPPIKVWIHRRKASIRTASIGFWLHLYTVSTAVTVFVLWTREEKVSWQYYKHRSRVEVDKLMLVSMFVIKLEIDRKTAHFGYISQTVDYKWLVLVNDLALHMLLKITCDYGVGLKLLCSTHYPLDQKIQAKIWGHLEVVDTGKLQTRISLSLDLRSGSHPPFRPGVFQLGRCMYYQGITWLLLLPMKQYSFSKRYYAGDEFIGVRFSDAASDVKPLLLVFCDHMWTGSICRWLICLLVPPAEKVE